MDKYLGKHPLEVQDYTIPTQAIELMVNAVYQWVDILLPGGFIYGNPRVGKTLAIQYIIPEIPNIFNSNIPAYHYLCSEKMVNSEGRFYEEMLLMVEHALSSGRTEQKRNRFINFLIESARENNEHRIILFVDEAQQLKEIHYNWLADIHNKLQLQKIKFIVILVGQKQLLNVKNSFRISGKQQLLSRFMACSHHFYGLQNVKELRRFLKGYDENSEFPEGSGITYTQYFIPKASGNGWQLADQANLIWQSLDKLLSSDGIKIRELPMQPLAILVHQILKELAEIDSEELGSIDPDMVMESIQYSCLADLVSYCSSQDPL